jgi:hypothetical protein
VAGLFFYGDDKAPWICRARNKKASTREAFSAIFRFFSLRTSPRCSGAKVKKETEIRGHNALPGRQKRLY